MSKFYFLKGISNNNNSGNEFSQNNLSKNKIKNFKVAETETENEKEKENSYHIGSNDVNYILMRLPKKVKKRYKFGDFENFVKKAE